MSRLLIVLFLSTLMAACSCNTPHRSFAGHKVYPGTPDNSEHNSIIETRNKGKPSEYDMVFVEFDDQGLLHDFKLKEKALEHLKAVTKDDSIVVIFTHGWHHNASSDDDNVQSFQFLLSKLALSQSASDKPRKVRGVYIGWRGDSIIGPVIEYLDFYDRKQSAHKVGFGATPLFLEIEKIVNQNKNNSLITIGHSFGGAVTYSALAPVLQSRYVATRNNDSIVRGFGDLVLLVNPAFEANLHLPLFQLTQDQCAPYNSNQPVRLLTVSSQVDSDVRWIFPTAQWFGGLTDNQEDGKLFIGCDPVKGPVEIEFGESYGSRTSPGNYSMTVTHCLSKEGGKYIIKHKNLVSDYNPYMTLFESGDLIYDHNKIWGDEFIEFVRIVAENKLYGNQNVTHQDNGKLLYDKCEDS